jgi:glycine cleavage system H protein
MTVLLVIVTFAAFVLIDYLIHRHSPARLEVGASSAPGSVGRTEPVWVAGYALPEGLSYHRGHTWARVLEGGDVVVGIDDFGSRLLGSPREVALPNHGSWLRQGEPSAALGVDGRKARLLSPVEGEVVAVNPELQTSPGLVKDDPYGRGWLFRVRPADLRTSLRNLLSGRLAHRWIEDARERLDMSLMAFSQSVLQDGGEPAADFVKHLSDEEWRGLVREFLLT